MSKLSSLLSSPSDMIQIGWNKLKKIPKGNIVFSALVSRLIPYTGSIKPIVLKIENGSSSVLLKDRKFVRNHLNSIHAIALANVGEFTTGLSIISQLPPSAQAILVKLQVEYLKKARGDLISETHFHLPSKLESESEFPLVAHIMNEKKEIVSKVTATWKLRL